MDRIGYPPAGGTPSEKHWLSCKSLSVLGRGDECLDHIGVDKVSVELVQLRQPEIESRVVGVLRIIRVAPQISKVLHQHKRAVELLRLERFIVRSKKQERSRLSFTYSATSIKLITALTTFGIKNCATLLCARSLLTML